MVIEMGDGRKAHGIRKKENFERELPVFFRDAASVNHVFVGTCFLMQVYSFYEGLADGERVVSGETLEIWQKVCSIAKENFLGEFDGARREEAVLALAGLRKEITAKMEVLTTYTDHFALYEYVLNRLEPRFEGELFLEEDDEAAREILRYIFLDKDNMLVNVRIQQMLSQLPVRMSRVKFEDLVRGAFEHYNGMDTGAVDAFVNRLLWVSGLYEPEGVNDYFPEFARALKAMEAVNLKQPQEEDYNKAQDVFTQTAKSLEVFTDNYYSLMEMVNLLYVWLLNYPYASKEAAEKTEWIVPLLRELCEKGLCGEAGFDALSEECGALMKQSEGILEEYIPKLQRARTALSKIAKEEEQSIAALMLSEEYACLKTSALLMSGSLFADIEKEVQPQTADRVYLKQAADSLLDKLLTAFFAQPLLLNRARIAAVLKELPVFFNSQNDVMDYVRTSLAGCHEKAEKAASIRLMRKLMEE